MDNQAEATREKWRISSYSLTSFLLIGLLFLFSNLSADSRKTNVKYVYHVKQPDFIGHVIYPLSELAQRKNAQWIYHRHEGKYKGKTYLDEIQISLLDCGWHDVVFLSTVDPKKDYLAQKEAGLSPPPRVYVCIPIDKLEGKWAAIWSPPSVDDPSRFDDRHFELLDPMNYPCKDEVEPRTQDYYRKCALEGKKAKIFQTHILVRGSIDISDVPTIRWESD